MIDDGVEEVCPSEDLFVQMIQGELSAAEKQALNEHIERCPFCEQLVFELADLMSHYSHAGSETISGNLLPEVLESTSHTKVPALDGYELREIIGAGGMGVVYRAHDDTLDRDVAVKVIRADLLHSNPGSETLSKRLIQEARMLARIEHPNVVSIYDASFHGDHLYIVMALVQGETLDHYVFGHELEWQAIVELYVQVCQGLVAAHQQGIVHRDVKPSNILIDVQGRAILTDFGLARAAMESAGESRSGGQLSTSLTRQGMVLGTPAFMPPEQHLGGRADERSDIFALCASLFWSVYRCRPFEGDSIEEVALNACSGELREISKDKILYAPLFDVLQKGMSRRKEDRYASVQELIDALEEVLRGSHQQSKPGGWWVAVVLVSGVLIAGLVMVPTQGRESQDEVGSVKQEEVKQPSVSSLAPEHVEQEEPGVDIAPVVAFALERVNVALDRGAEEHLRVASTQQRVAKPVSSTVAVTRPRKASPGVVASASAASKEDGTESRSDEQLGKLLVSAQARVNRAVEMQDVKACRAALEPIRDVPERSRSLLWMYEAFCLELEGKCDEAKQRYIRAYEVIAPGMDMTGFLEGRESMCRPPKSESAKYLSWRSIPFYVRNVSICKRNANEIINALSVPSIWDDVMHREDERLSIRNGLETGLKCIARSTEDTCELARDMAEMASRLSSVSSDIREDDIKDRLTRFYGEEKTGACIQ